VGGCWELGYVSTSYHHTQTLHPHPRILNTPTGGTLIFLLESNFYGKIPGYGKNYSIFEYFFENSHRVATEA
jgi:hypothetical protein